jgi:hypothetical protein
MLWVIGLLRIYNKISSDVWIVNMACFQNNADGDVWDVRNEVPQTGGWSLVEKTRLDEIIREKLWITKGVGDNEEHRSQCRTHKGMEDKIFSLPRKRHEKLTVWLVHSSFKTKRTKNEGCWEIRLKTAGWASAGYWSCRLCALFYRRSCLYTIRVICRIKIVIRVAVITNVTIRS